MSTQNGQSVCPSSNSANTTVDTRHVSKIKKALLPAQAEFLDFIMFHGVGELSKSLKKIHDLALYHSDICFDQAEKAALYDLKILWEKFERIGKEA